MGKGRLGGASAAVGNGGPGITTSPDPTNRVGLVSRLSTFLTSRLRVWGFLIPLHIVAFGFLYWASVRMNDAHILDATADATREHLKHESEELQAVALIQTGEQEGGHPFAELLPAHNIFNTQLYLASGEILSPREGMTPVPEAAIASFLATGQTREVWLDTEGGSTVMRGLMRIIATPDCAPCHEIGSTRAVASMDFDMTEILSRTHGRIRLNLALLILTWGVLLGITSSVIKRSTRRSIHDLEAGLKAIDSGAGTLEEFDRQEMLDPVTAELHDQLADFLHRHKERQAEITDRLDRSDRITALGKLTVGLAKGIKNPLAGVQGALQVLQNSNRGAPDAHLYEEMLEQLEGVDRTLKTLLSCAEPSPLSLARVDVGQYLEQVAESLRPSLDQEGIHLEVAVPEGGLEAVLDPVITHQVLRILVENGAEAMQGEGTIRLRGGPLPAGKGTLVSVEDDGPGIAEENHERIFEPFVTTKYSRPGLGLAMARSLIEQHGGTVQVESTLDEGTTFLILLPEPDEPPFEDSGGE